MVGMVPPMSLFLHVVLTTFGLVLAHLHPNSILALAIFRHFCGAFIWVQYFVPLFCYFYSAQLDTSDAIYGTLVFRICPQMVMRYIIVTHRV
jgi:hypothetical protein